MSAPHEKEFAMTAITSLLGAERSPQNTFYPQTCNKYLFKVNQCPQAREQRATIRAFAPGSGLRRGDGA